MPQPHPVSRLRLSLFVAATVVVIGASKQVAGQSAAASKSSAEFRRQLESRGSVSWSGRPLREALLSLSHSTDLAVFLDRRVDPDQLIEVTAKDQPLEQVFQQIAQAAHCQAATISSVIYIGPPSAASKLATIAALQRQAVSRLPNAVKTRLLATGGWSWDDLTQPRELLARLAAEAGVRLLNPEIVPHDLWPAGGSAQALPWADRLSLLLIGFDLTFEIADGGSSVRLVPLPTSVALEKAYTPRGPAADFARQIHEIAPTAQVRLEAGRHLVSATVEDHQRLEQAFVGSAKRVTKKPEPGGEKRYSLQVSNKPAGAVLRAIAKQLGKELAYEMSLTDKLQREVDLNVKDVTLDALLTATLKPLQLSYKLTDTSLDILELK